MIALYQSSLVTIQADIGGILHASASVEYGKLSSANAERASIAIFLQYNISNTSLTVFSLD
jgi:hypothetical protein